MGRVGNASWSRKELFDPLWYRGTGTNLTRAVIALTEDLGSHGRIGLHSLPWVNGFHADTCGMTDLGADADDESLRYFETMLEQARASICARGEHVMKLEIRKEWCVRMAQLEGDAEIGAGRLAVDPVFDGEVIPVAAGDEEGSNVAFGRFVRLMRRQRGLTLERLADDADVDMADLVEIESKPHHKPELRTAYQLANYFKVPRSGFLQVAGLTGPKDTKLFDEAVRFAARSEPTAALTSEESAALEAFVAVLSEQS